MIRRGLFTLLALVPLALGCPGGETSGQAKGKKGGPPPAVPVVLGEIVQKTVPIQVSDIGEVMPNQTVAVRAQVGGALTKVHVVEGQDVKAGDLLFEIDPRPLQASLAQAEAELSRQTALRNQARSNRERTGVQLRTAQADLERNRRLFNEGIISQTEFDRLSMAAGTLQAGVEADEAAIASANQAIRAAQAQIEAANLQLQYTSITAPVDGRLGEILVDQGNLIRANDDDPLIVINQIRPIQVQFALPERHLEAIRKRMETGPLPVETNNPDSDAPPARGELTFLNNQVDRATGTILMKATFPNEDARLWPGQYVNVTLTLGQLENAVLAPRQAILEGQNGPYAYVVGPEQAVQARQVRTGQTVGDQIVILEGLNPGDKIVTEGHLRLANGVRVTEKKDIPLGAPIPAAEESMTTATAKGGGS